MSEMNSPENKDAAENVEAYLAERQAWMREAVEVVTGDPNQDPLEIFPAATEVRADGQALELTADAETALREVAGRFGIGGEKDVHSGSNHQLIEGGLAWKIDAEAAITDATDSIVYAGSEHRPINREDEVAYMKNRLGEDVAVGANEYEIARQLAELEPGFEPLEEDIVLPFGYDISDGFKLVQETTGQLVQIGTNNGRPVTLLRVDRENYVDEEGANKYRNQPDSAALMGIISDILTAAGDEESTVGMNTSNTYSSRVIDAVRAGLRRGRSFDVGMYGRQTLADVKGEAAAEPTAINQIPGELHTIYAKLQQLEAELKEQK